MTTAVGRFADWVEWKTSWAWAWEGGARRRTARAREKSRMVLKIVAEG
jgi:hypothetical protein